MNKENNRSAAGLRRSAVAERIRIREEWSALKGTENTTTKRQNVINTIRANVAKNILNDRKKVRQNEDKEKNKTKPTATSDALRGVVVLVEVGSETKALPLRAALSALGASVVPAWNPLVTHLIWSGGGCRSTRAKARALACRVVSPLWAEACAAGGRRLPEHAFPAAHRPSDLPSPKTLRHLLKKADAENIPLFDLLNDSKEPPLCCPTKLRISSETEHDTTATTDTSHDTSADKSRDKNDDTTGIQSRVNTAPRRALPLTSVSPPKPSKSRRKLFTHKEAEVIGSSDESDIEEQNKPTQRERKELARAERMAKRLLAACSRNGPSQVAVYGLKPRIVLTGMGRTERQRVTQAIQSLGGKIQNRVNKRTTHVLLGSCRDDDGGNEDMVNPNITGITVQAVHRSDTIKARTVNALSGAARGCRVLAACWAQDCLQAGRWLHHHGYEVPHLKKISQKARVERTALCKLHSEYAYDVFNGMRVKVTPSTQQKDAAIQLLTLCGAIVIDSQTLQDGGGLTADFDITLGTGDGEISSKWVFDSVAAARMRTARRYKNNYIINSQNITTQLTDR